MSRLRFPAAAARITSYLVVGIGAAACSPAVKPAAHAAGAAGRAPDAPSALRWLKPEIDAARLAGAGDPTLLANGAGAPGDSLGGRITVPAGSCALFLAAGGPTVEDVDLFVYGDDGALLAADERTERTAAALFCPAGAVGAYAFARLAGGHGPYALSLQVTPKAVSDAVAQAVGTTGKLGPRAVAAAEAGFPGLDEAVLEHRRALGGTWRETRRLALPVDPALPTSLSVAAEPGDCVDTFVMPAEEVAFLELSIVDSAGRIVGRAATDARSPSVVFCSAERAEVTLELRPHAGKGLAAVVLAVSKTVDRANLPAAFSIAPGAEGPVEEARHVIAAELVGKGYGAPARVGAGTASVGRRTTLDVKVPAGCSRLDVVGGSPLSGLELWLWTQSGILVAHDDGSSRAALFACGAAQTLRLDVEARTRSGPFAAELRSLAGLADVLAQRPLAASRLLGRLAAAGRLEHPRTQAVTRLAVSPTALASSEVTLPPSQCTVAAAALDRGVEGLELRAIDVATKEELARTEGAYSALLGLCAPPGQAETVRFELVVQAGAGDALFAAQLVPIQVVPEPALHRPSSPPATAPRP